MSTNGDWNNWPANRAYLPLMQELLRYAVAGRLREHAINVGEPLEEYFQAKSSPEDAVVHFPSERSEAVRTQNQDDMSVLRWINTDQKQ